MATNLIEALWPGVIRVHQRTEDAYLAVKPFNAQFFQEKLNSIFVTNSIVSIPE
jgi:hypothetical protein